MFFFSAKKKMEYGSFITYWASDSIISQRSVIEIDREATMRNTMLDKQIHLKIFSLNILNIVFVNLLRLTSATNTNLPNIVLQIARNDNPTERITINLETLDLCQSISTKNALDTMYFWTNLDLVT